MNFVVDASFSAPSDPSLNKLTHEQLRLKVRSLVLHYKGGCNSTHCDIAKLASLTPDSLATLLAGFSREECLAIICDRCACRASV